MPAKAKLIEDFPVTKIEVVADPKPQPRAKRTRPLIEPPISPATPIFYKKRIWWQLQLDFTKIAGAYIPDREAEARADEDFRIAKGIADRDGFMKIVGTPFHYDEMRRIAKGEIIKSLNRTNTMRGLAPWDEEQIWMDHFHDTIVKVSRLLELGQFGLPKKGQVIESGDMQAEVVKVTNGTISAIGESGAIEISYGGFHRKWKIVDGKEPNVKGYFYVFLKKDASRYVKAMDSGNMNAIVL